MRETEARSERSRVRRNHKIAHYDRETINAVLDAGFLAHVGYVGKHGVGVTPTCYWRRGNYLYWHGSTASGTMRQAKNRDVCVTVTHFDGLVLATSAFHHSANYRTVMIFGEPEPVSDDEEKAEALRAFVDQLVPERWETLRPMNDKELKATAILRLEIDDASVKIRSGNVNDEPEDVALPIWSGVVPAAERFSAPVADPLKPADLVAPDEVRNYEGRTFEETLKRRGKTA